jgi:hypothetical protein
MRPGDYWKGFLAPIGLIVKSLLAKASGQRWFAEISYQRQQYWWAGYQIQSRISGAAEGLRQLLRRGVIAATHSFTHRERIPYRYRPHRIFAMTPARAGP